MESKLKFAAMERAGETPTMAAPSKAVTQPILTADRIESLWKMAERRWHDQRGVAPSKENIFTGLIEADLRASLSAPVAAVAGSIGDDVAFLGRTIAAAVEAMDIGPGEEWRSFVAYIDSLIQSAALTGQKNGGNRE